jgi:hypothetical protein
MKIVKSTIFLVVAVVFLVTLGTFRLEAQAQTSQNEIASALVNPVERVSGVQNTVLKVNENQVPVVTRTLDLSLTSGMDVDRYGCIDNGSTAVCICLGAQDCLRLNASGECGAGGVDPDNCFFGGCGCPWDGH